MITDKTYKKTPQEIDIEFGDVWKSMLKLRTRLAEVEEQIEELTEMLKAEQKANSDKLQDLQKQLFRKV